MSSSPSNNNHHDQGGTEFSNSNDHNGSHDTSIPQVVPYSQPHWGMEPGPALPPAVMQGMPMFGGYPYMMRSPFDTSINPFPMQSSQLLQRGMPPPGFSQSPHFYPQSPQLPDQAPGFFNPYISNNPMAPQGHYSTEPSSYPILPSRAGPALLRPPSSQNDNISEDDIADHMARMPLESSTPSTGKITQLKQISVTSLFAAASNREAYPLPSTSRLSSNGLFEGPLGSSFPTLGTVSSGDSQDKSRVLMSLLRPDPYQQQQSHQQQQQQQQYKYNEQLGSIIGNIREIEQSTLAEDTNMKETEEDENKNIIASSVAEKKGNAKAGKRQHGPIRSTGNQTCELILLKGNRNRREEPLAQDTCCIPEQNLTVVFKLPLNSFPGKDEAEIFKMDIIIGLFRYGSPDNTKSVVSKSIAQASAKKVENDIFGKKILSGEMLFRTPKTAGCFVFRIFDKTTSESAIETLGTSNRVFNELYDSDVTNMLLRGFTSFVPDKVVSDNLTALIQFRSTVDGMKNGGKNVRNAEPAILIQKSFDYTLQILELTYSLFDDSSARTSQQKAAAASADDVPPVAKEPKDSAHWEALSIAKRFHVEAYDTFIAITRNQFVWKMLLSGRQHKVDLVLLTYSHFAHRFFSTIEALHIFHREMLGFLPAGERAQGVRDNAAVKAINAAIRIILPSLLPPPSFLEAREAIAKKFEDIINSTNQFPSSQLRLFGSSRNGFGSVSSDVDMCLMLSGGNVVTEEEKKEKIDIVGNILSDAGMMNLEVRSTARIPIIVFKDPVAGLDCDISLHNALSISNTDLLHTYSSIDPRVRSLAYIIKTWSKQRHCNSPGDGTLSSYGYILCLIHFLQNIDKPILPNLQSLPADWNGEVITEKTIAGADYQLCNDNIPCNTYFLNPNKKQLDLLQNAAKENKLSVAELLADFFEYFSCRFDYRRDIVSVRFHSNSCHPFIKNMKLVKAEEDCWQMHDRLSIEDPFETFYNVAHVIKSTQMHYISKEFLRAHTLLSRCLYRLEQNTTDEVPSAVDPETLLDLLLSEAPLPAFCESKIASAVETLNL